MRFNSKPEQTRFGACLLPFLRCTTHCQLGKAHKGPPGMNLLGGQRKKVLPVAKPVWGHTSRVDGLPTLTTNIPFSYSQISRSAIPLTACIIYSSRSSFPTQPSRTDTSCILIVTSGKIRGNDLHGQGKQEFSANPSACAIRYQTR